MSKIESSFLNLKVSTRNLSGGTTLGEVLGAEPVLLAFIRHFG